jgi:pyrroline-5-carboxylate reductase
MLTEQVSTLANCTAIKNARVQLSHCTEAQLHAYLHLINIGPQYIYLLIESFRSVWDLHCMH